MFRKLIFLMLPIFVGSIVYAQSFSLVPRSTSANGTPNQVAEFKMDITNLTTGELPLTISYTRINLPEDWVVNICIGEACYPDFMTSIPYTMNPSMIDSISLDIFPSSNGSQGVASLTVSRNGTSEQITVTCTLTTNSSSVNEILPTSTFLTSVYPNPFNSNSKLKIQTTKPEEVTISIFDRIGRIIYTMNQSLSTGYHSFDLEPSFQNVTSGSYFVTIRTKTTSYIHPIQYLR